MISAKTIKKTALAPTVLISHGGGFLAAHLAQTLLLKNCRVVVLSNLERYPDPHLQKLLKSTKFALFDCDINTELPKAIESVDYIFHLANYDTFLPAQTNPDLEGLLSAGVGTKHLLDLAKESHAKFALVLPVASKAKNSQQEGVSPAEAQKYSRSLVLEYRQRYELDARFVYLGQVYGVNMDLEQSGELGSLLTDLLADQALKICDDGVRKEFYTYFSDAVNGLVKSLFSAGVNQTFSLTEEKPHTSLEVAYLLRSLAAGQVDLTFEECGQVYEAPKLAELSYPSTWSIKVELRDGLIKTLKSLGYKPNTKTFKAGCLIEERMLEKLKSPLGGKEDLKSITPSPRREPRINPVKLLLCRTEKSLRQVHKKVMQGDQTLFRLKMLAGVAAGFVSLSGVFFGVPLLQARNHAGAALADLENYQAAIARLDAQKASQSSEDAYAHLVKLEKALQRLAPLFKLTGKAEAFSSWQALAESSKNFSSALYSLSLGTEPFADLWDGLKPNGNPNFNLAEFQESSVHFTDAKHKLSFAQAALNMVNRDHLPGQIQADFDKYQSALVQINENSDFLTQLALEFPGLIGLDGPKRYLFLFQNNNEIRPTGGFLGSYAIVEIKDGKLVKIDLDDIYNPDGQLKLRGANDHIKSPTPIARALAEENLYIRNANWDPSFPASTQTISQLFKLAGVGEFNGVFAIDLYFARDLLAVTGPLYLTAYEEEIRVDNMYERVQFHSDFDFQEGVSAKKAFMTVLGGKMLEKLFALPQDKIPSLLNVLYASLEQKHLLINFPGSYLSKYLAERSWDGSLISTSGDYLYVVNANLGGTKSNYFVRNSMNYAVSAKTSDGVLRGELELAYENTQKDASWPGGPYTDYVRVLVQEGSKLTGAYLMGGEQSALIAQNSDDVMGAANGVNIYDQVVISRVGKYTSFEYQIVVNPQEKVKLILTYDLPASLSATKDSNKYSLVWQKQPGTQNDAMRFMFAAPFGTRIANSIPAGSSADNIYEYKSTLNGDLRISLSYR